MFTIGSIVSHFSHDVPYVQSIPSLQKDLNLPPPPNDTYKGFRMTMRIMLYSILWKVQVVEKGRFLRENPGSWEPEIYAQNPSWGSVENSGRFTRKNIDSGQTSGSVYLSHHHIHSKFGSSHFHLGLKSPMNSCFFSFRGGAAVFLTPGQESLASREGMIPIMSG